MKKILLIVLSFSFQAHSTTPNKTEISKDVFFGADVLDIEEHSSAMAQMILTRQPEWDKHKKLIKERASTILSSESYQNKVAEIIANNFTRTELIQLKELMQNPIMVKWNKKMPEFWPEVTMAATDHVMPGIYELITTIKEEENYLSNTENDIELLKKFNILIRGRNCTEALKLSEQLLSKDANNIHAIYNKAFCYQIEKSYEKSLQLFLSVHKLNPKYRHINFHLANLYLILHKDDDAIKHAYEEIDLYPESSNSFYILAKVHGYIGNKEESLKAFNRSLLLNPKNLSSLVELASIYYNNGYKVDSCNTFKKAELINPKISGIPLMKEACGL